MMMLLPPISAPKTAYCQNGPGPTGGGEGAGRGAGVGWGLGVGVAAGMRSRVALVGRFVDPRARVGEGHQRLGPTNRRHAR